MGLFKHLFTSFYPETPGSPQVPMDNVDTQPIDVMEMPTPEPTPPRPKSFDDIPTKRRKYQRSKNPSGSETKVLGEYRSPSSSTRAPTSTGTPSSENMSPPEVATSDVAPDSEPKPSKSKRRRTKKRSTSIANSKSTIDFSEPMATPSQSPDEVVDVKALASRAGVH